MHGEDAVHARQIERDAAERRIDVTLERGAGAERDHRHAGLGAELHDVGDLGFALGEQDGVGRLALEPGERIGVLLAQRLAHGEAVAEARGKLGEQRALALRRGRSDSAMTAVMGPSYRVLRRESLRLFGAARSGSTTKMTAAKWQLAADSTKPCQMAF